MPDLVDGNQWSRRVYRCDCEQSSRAAVKGGVHNDDNLVPHAGTDSVIRSLRGTGSSECGWAQQFWNATRVKSGVEIRVFGCIDNAVLLIGSALVAGDVYSVNICRLQHLIPRTGVFKFSKSPCNVGRIFSVIDLRLQIAIAQNDDHQVAAI